MEVIVYSAEWCPWCHKLTDFLKENDIKFEERDLDKDPKFGEELQQITGQGGVPVTVIDGKTAIIGFDVLKLKEILKI